ncbi:MULTISPECIES: N-acetylmuramoyl-L-alanine amidase [Lactobacillales]|uniref:N-acetylmuramoyl-L-alanine amidase n=1 Tax=Lactobacillales TaxID=186826 RepID=UPI002FC65450
MTIKTTHAGHGGIDPGAVGNGYKEADVARLYNAKILQLTGAINATDDSAVSVPDNLAKIVAKVNAVSGNDDWNISIHLNAFTSSATGVEVYAYSQDAAGMAKAAEISAKLATVYGIQNRGAKAGDELYVIKNTKGHMLLIELGFISNANDLNQILSKIDQACTAIVTSFGYTGTPAPPQPVGPVLKIINLWDYTGADWLPKIQKSYANVVSADRAFKVKTGSSWRVRLTYINYAQAVFICDELRKVYPKYTATGYRINTNDPIQDTTPFAVEVDSIPEADIENVLRHVQQTYAGIITADRIFLTPQLGTNPAQVTLEMYNFKESQRATIISQLKERYGISDNQFK